MKDNGIFPSLYINKQVHTDQQTNIRPHREVNPPFIFVNNILSSLVQSTHYAQCVLHLYSLKQLIRVMGHPLSISRRNTGCSLNIVCFSENVVIFLNSASSVAVLLVFYLPFSCPSMKSGVHT